ncbi:MAG: thiamine pyrophosphate-dependent enzyme [Planctomycetota bacterium]|jgi:indolepyruvate ferredoxin oxidoreductase alpha subunit
MKSEVLLSDEAVGLAAIHAGVRAAFSYPGTPATEILESIERYARSGNGAAGPITSWSTNEKVAYEEALGVSYAGQRALVSMKHVGLNVAADPFISSAITGAHGALVVVVVDDAGMHSSQNEQDSRYYAHFARLPAYEPADQQEAYDMTLAAFEDSQRLGLPVMVRLVTRLAHSRACVQVRSERQSAPDLGIVKEPDDWTLIPPNARRQFNRLVRKHEGLLRSAEESPYNQLRLAGRRGIICAGIAYNYVRENQILNGDRSLLRVSHYPLPAKKIREIVAHCDEILVVEEGYPFIEEQIDGVVGISGTRLLGRRSGHLPATGELTPESVRSAAGLAPAPAPEPIAELAERPPQLCQGCPHADSYHHIVEALKPYEGAVLFSDIGCYTLGALPPYNVVKSCVDMGASIGMARGAALAGVHPACCAIGDSTFVHSGMTPLIAAAQDDANVTVFILDNATAAMTGWQRTLATGDELVNLVAGLGVKPDHIQVIEPLSKFHEGNVRIIRREIDHPGLAVIISKRACIHVAEKGCGMQAAQTEGRRTVHDYIRRDAGR